MTENGKSLTAVAPHPTPGWFCCIPIPGSVERDKTLPDNMPEELGEILTVVGGVPEGMQAAVVIEIGEFSEGTGQPWPYSWGKGDTVYIGSERGILRARFPGSTDHHIQALPPAPGNEDPANLPAPPTEVDAGFVVPGGP